MPYKDDDMSDFDKVGKGDSESPEELEHRPDDAEARACEVKIVGVFEDASQAYFVLLRDSMDRQLPILIGPFEAQAIALGFNDKRVTPRPFTHDLLKNIIEHLGAKVDRLTIDSLFQETYYAKLSLLVGERISDVDCRPSDGIALAVRAGAPIYVAEPVLEETERGRESHVEPEE